MEFTEETTAAVAATTPESTIESTSPTATPVNDEAALQELMAQYKAQASKPPPPLPKTGISWAAAARKNATQQDHINTEKYLKELNDKLESEKSTDTSSSNDKVES